MRRTPMPIPTAAAAAALLALALAPGCAPGTSEGALPAATVQAPPSAPAPAQPATPTLVAPKPKPAPVEAAKPAPAKPVSAASVKPAAPGATATATLKLTVSDGGKLPAGAKVTAVCGDRKLDVPVGADGVAVAGGLAKGEWSFEVSAPGCYGVVGAVNVDPEEAQNYTLPVRLDPEKPAAGEGKGGAATQ